MISVWISVVPPTIACTRLSPQGSPSWRRAADWCSRRSRRASSGQRELRRSRGAIWAAITRHGIIWPRRSSPVRGVAPTTTPNQRPRISQPSMRTSTPVSSSRHSCHRSSCARCQRRQPGGGVLRRAAARRSIPRPGSGRSPRQHGHVRRSMTTVAAHAVVRRVGSLRASGPSAMRPGSGGWRRPRLANHDPRVHLP